MLDDRSRMRHGDMPLLDRIDVALRRVTNGEGQMRVPVEVTDSDVVLHDCKVRIAELEAALAESISMAAKICDGRDALEAMLAEAYNNVRKANESAERFEREWYLRGDELERTQTALAEAEKQRDAALEDAGSVKLAFEDWRVVHSTMQLEAENERLRDALKAVVAYRTGGLIERLCREALENTDA